MLKRLKGLLKFVRTYRQWYAANVNAETGDIGGNPGTPPPPPPPGNDLDDED